ncbi:MAG: hypothetical protein ACUVXI_04870 [bacterium]
MAISERFGSTETIERIQKAVGCSELEARAILDVSGGNAEEAINLAKSEDRCIYIIKGSFSTARERLRGVLAIVVNVQRKVVERVGALATYDPSYHLPSIKDNWRQFEKSLYGRKFSPEVVQNITRDTQEYIRDRLSSSDKDLFFSLLEGRSFPEIQDSLAGILRKVLDREVDLEIDVDEVTLMDFVKIEDRGEAEKKVEKEEEENVILRASLEVDPIQGIPVSRLRPKDTVFVDIKEDTPVAQRVRNVLSRGGTRGIRGVVESVLPREVGGWEIRVDLAPGIMGSAVVNEDIRAKVSDQAGRETRGRETINTTIYIAAAIAILLILLMLIIFNKV